MYKDFVTELLVFGQVRSCIGDIYTRNDSFIRKLFEHILEMALYKKIVALRQGNDAPWLYHATEFPNSSDTVCQVGENAYAG